MVKIMWQQRMTVKILNMIQSLQLTIKSKKGDTMTINYDKNVIPSDLTDKNDPIDITDPSGEVIAKVHLIKQLSKSHIHLQTM